MPQWTSDDMEKSGVETAASMMATAARTAPKTRGVDSVRTLLVNGEELESLAKAMEEKLKEKEVGLPTFPRDANNVRGSGGVLLIGVSWEPKRIETPLNCGACGYGRCKELVRAGRHPGEDFVGPICIFQAIDLGISLGSAVKMATELNIDNRIMYTIGAAAKKLGLLDSDIIMGIPLSVKGKNPFFDR